MFTAIAAIAQCSHTEQKKKKRRKQTLPRPLMKTKSSRKKGTTRTETTHKVSGSSNILFLWKMCEISPTRQRSHKHSLMTSEARQESNAVLVVGPGVQLTKECNLTNPSPCCLCGWTKLAADNGVQPYQPAVGSVGFSMMSLWLVQVSS